MIELDPSSVIRIPVRVGISGKCFLENTNYISEDAQKDWVFNPDSDNKTPFKILNLLISSMKTTDNTPNGVI